MIEVTFNAYFEDLVPVIEIIDIGTPGTIEEVENELFDFGMEKVREHVYLQSRGGLNIKLLKTKMRKRGFVLKRTMFTTNPKACVIPKNQYFDYIHFVPGTFIDRITIDKDTFFFFKKGSTYNVYSLAWCPKNNMIGDPDVNFTKISNNVGETIKIIIFWSAFTWAHNYENACKQFATKYSIDRNKIKSTTQRYYHIVEKV